MEIFREAIAPIRISSKLHMEVCVVDQELEKVNVVLPQVTDIVVLKRQEAEVSWKRGVVDFAQLVVGQVQVFDVVEVGQVTVCGDLFDLVP